MIFTLEEITDFVRKNLGKDLIDNKLLDWYLSRLYDKEQFLIVYEDNEIKAIQGYFLCEENDLPYIETLEWCLPLNFTNGDILYLALTVSTNFRYLKAIGEEVRRLIKQKSIHKVIAYDIRDKEVKIWTRLYNKWSYKQGNLNLLQEVQNV